MNENKESFFGKKSSVTARMRTIYNLAAAGYHSKEQVKAIAEIFSLNDFFSESQNSIIFNLRKTGLITGDKIHNFAVALSASKKRLFRGLSPAARGSVISHLLRYRLVMKKRIKNFADGVSENRKRLYFKLIDHHRMDVVQSLIKSGYHSKKQIKAVTDLFTRDVYIRNRHDIIGLCKKYLVTADEIQSFADAVNENKKGLFSDSNLHDSYNARIMSSLIKTGFHSNKQIKAVTSLFQGNIFIYERHNIIDTLASRGITGSDELQSFADAVNENKKRLFRGSFNNSDIEFCNAEIMSSLIKAGLYSKKQIKAVTDLFTRDISFYKRHNIIDILASRGITGSDELQSFADAVNENKKRLFNGGYYDLDIITSLVETGLHSKEKIQAFTNFFTENTNNYFRRWIILTLFFSGITEGKIQNFADALNRNSSLIAKYPDKEDSIILFLMTLNLHHGEEKEYYLSYLFSEPRSIMGDNKHKTILPDAQFQTLDKEGNWVNKHFATFAGEEVRLD